MNYRGTGRRFVDQLPGVDRPSAPLPDVKQRMSMSELTALCRRLKASDQRAYEEVFRLLRGDLVRYVRAIVRNDMDAHDLVQDVFVALWGLREDLDPSRSLKAYLFGMARNRAYRHLRDVRLHARKHDLLRLTAAAQPQGTPGPEASFDAHALDHKLQTWIDELPTRQREALLLSRAHGLSHREIAALMQVSPRTVNNHIIHALNHLRDRLQVFEPSLLDG